MAADPNTLGDCCTSGTLHEGTAAGSVQNIYGLSTYVTGEKSDKVIFMLSDVFGYELINTRLLADDYAKAGFYVLLPDLFSGDSLPAEVEHQMMPPESMPPRGFFTAAKEYAQAAGAYAPWMYRHREGVSRPIIDSFLKGLREDLPNAKVGGVGFCW